MSAAENTVTRTWSPYQTAIFSFVETGTGNAVIEAVAGSGKTTTIVEAVRRSGGDHIFLAFNKSIAGELQSRGVNAKTFHGLCYAPLASYTGGKLNADKLRDILFAAIESGGLSAVEAQAYGTFAKKLVGLARQAGGGCLVADEEHVWSDIVEHHDLSDDLGDNCSVARGIAIARRLLEVSNEMADFDFDDMLYRVVKDGVRLTHFDFVYVDEAQDTNAIQRAILRKIMHGGSRLVAVGDPAQAIYGFRGADSSSLGLIASEFSCVRLPLTVSYRCPQAVVRHAQKWVSHIEAAPSAPEGEVTSLMSWKADTFNPGDMVVCRTTAPLISLAYALLKAKRPVKVMGREIAQGLVGLVNRMQAAGIPRLVEKLEAWGDRETQRAIAKGNEARAAAVADQVESLLSLIAGLGENEKTVPGLIRLIESLFAEVKNAVVLATIHKSKGLEARRVFWLDSHKCPSKWARKDWQIEQELNLMYVATTRAIDSLILIDSEGRSF